MGRLVSLIMGVVAVLLLSAAGSTAEATSGSAPLAYEWNTAVAGSPPGGLPCGEIAGARVCFEAGGDRWWIRDTAADGQSAVGDWMNYVNGSFYRSGGCRNGLGSGTWGYCNKNYTENSLLYFRPCRYEGSTGQFVTCSSVWSTVRA